MSMSSRRSSRQPRCILLLLKLLFLAALVELLRCLPLHAVSASQGLQCRIPDGLFDLLFMHVKLPAFRDFDNFGLNSMHCHLQFCQVRSSAHRFGEALFQLSLWLFIALLAQVTLSSDLITLLSSLLQAKETLVSLHFSYWV